jgi:hypothetical protein
MNVAVWIPAFLALTIILSLGFLVCGVSESPHITYRAPISAVITPTPLPQNANIADQNFRKDWQADYESSKADLANRRERWEAKDLTNYDFVVAKYIGGVSSPWNRSPVRIKVRGETAASIEVLDKSDISLLARTDGFEEFDTIPKLFDYLLAQLENGNIIKVDYDRDLGYPKRASVTFTYNSSHNIRSIVISNLLALEK